MANGLFIFDLRDFINSLRIEWQSICLVQVECQYWGDQLFTKKWQLWSESAALLNLQIDNTGYTAKDTVSHISSNIPDQSHIFQVE